jgi:hypothetical protein
MIRYKAIFTDERTVDKLNDLLDDGWEVKSVTPLTATVAGVPGKAQEQAQFQHSHGPLFLILERNEGPEGVVEMRRLPDNVAAMIKPQRKGGAQ